MSKSNVLTLILSFIFLMFTAACNENPNEKGEKTNEDAIAKSSDPVTSVDTMIIRDTIVIRDTIDTGIPQALVSADKMNVFYLGVDNPISFNLSGISPNDLRVQTTGPISIRGNGTNRIVTASNPGEARINLSTNGRSVGSYIYRVKRIPDPVARLSSKSGGAMSAGEFKAQGGVGAFLDNFDFDAKCQIAGFNLVYIAKRQDAIESQNRGARYNDKSRQLIRQAKPGDIYYFDNVRAKCPGDNATRKINPMVFKIM